jgi:LuxR family maltose regulon positive regulatory protein
MEHAAARQLQGEIDFLRAYQLALMGASQRAQACAQRALASLPDGNFGMVANLHTIVALGHFESDAEVRALAYIDRELARAPSHLSLYQARLLFAPCLIHWATANLSGLERSAAMLLRHAQDSGQMESIAIGHFWTGCVRYSRNELVAVEELLVDTVRDFVGSENYVYYNAAILTLTYLALNRVSAAQAVIDSATEYAVAMGSPGRPSLLQALQAELDLRQGRLPEARRWAASYDPYPLGQSPRLYLPQLTLVKVLMAQATTGSRDEAEKLLIELRNFLQSRHVANFLIDVFALQALLQDAQGDDAAALATLDQALALAEPGGFIRKFVDLGDAMQRLLARRREQVGPSAHVDQILAAFPSAPSPAAPVAPLTERELQVLRMLATEASTRQIADTLVVSVGTLRTHIKRIYGKLDAHSRYEAVQRAQTLSLL